MPTHESLAVAYHQQDTDYYCGASRKPVVMNEHITQALMAWRQESEGLLEQQTSGSKETDCPSMRSG